MSDLAAAPGGWVRYNDGGGGVRFYLRYDMTGERPVTVEAFAVSTQRISGRTWRHVPFDDIDGWVGRPSIAAILSMPGADTANPAAEIEDRLFGDSRCQKAEAIVIGDHGTLPELSALARPRGGLSDTYLAELAAAYYALVSARLHPAGPIAEQCGVSPRTVHRWVSVARARGFIGPAVRGRAG